MVSCRVLYENRYRRLRVLVIMYANVRYDSRARLSSTTEYGLRLPATRLLAVAMSVAMLLVFG